MKAPLIPAEYSPDAAVKPVAVREEVRSPWLGSLRYIAFGFRLMALGIFALFLRAWRADQWELGGP